MRKFLSILCMAVAAALAIGASGMAAAQTLPYQNPTYIPSAVLAPVTLSAPGTVLFNSTGASTLSLRVSGTCTAVAGTLQASNDNGANYSAINLYPIATGTTAPVAVASFGAAGFWKANVTAFTNIKVNVTALTASCAFALVATQGDFAGTTF